MRLIAAVAAALLTAAPAAAQRWTEYTYLADTFSVAFPAKPQVDTMTYQAADGRPAEGRVYSVSQGGCLTVADLSDPALQESVVLDHALRTLAEGRSVKVDIAHHINRIYDRASSA